MAFPANGTIAQLRRSRIARLAGIALLAIALQIPISMIAGLITERQQRRDGAVGEVSEKWGGAQAITGPILAVPYTYRFEAISDGKAVEKTALRTALILPDKLDIRGDVAAEIRSRGIFSVPVYGLDVVLSGEFAAADIREIGVAATDIFWERAELIVGISDVRAINRQPELTWDAQSVAFLPGTGLFKNVGDGIRAPVVVAPGSDRIAFQFPLLLNGSGNVSFVPFGRRTAVELQGNSADASFRGNWLPAERTLTEKSFSAKWSIPYLGRAYPQIWLPETDGIYTNSVEASRFGVALVPAMDAYRMAERSVKYSFLFIVLTFTVLWLLEVLSDVRVHPIQYLLMGAALCLFYLLELSLAEHIGFAAAYAAASTAVVSMIGGYGLTVLRTKRRAAAVATGVAALYGYLYVLLTNEDYALLLGSLGLFAVVAGIMYATRRVDWYAVGRASQGIPDG